MNLIEKIVGKKRTKEERYAEIEEAVDQLAYKWSLIRNIILTWMEFQKEFLK